MISTYLPAALVLAFAALLGTFPGAADGPLALAGHVVLFAILAGSGSEWARRPRWLAASLLVIGAALAAWWMSPVARAGSTALALLPAFFAIPLVVARAWRRESARRRGVLSLAIVLGIVAIWALVGQVALDTPGASLPIGHHNLLAAFLVVLLPLVTVPILHSPGPGWAWGIGAGLIGLVALVATESLGGLLAVAATIAFAAARRLSSRKGWLVFAGGAVGAAALVGVLQRDRLLTIWAGEDVSALARWSYWAAGWRGFEARPVFGWGPGASRWTLAEHLQPIPGVHPPDQVVADLHGTALQVLYETGWVGAAALFAALALVFLRRGFPTGDSSEAADPPVERAATRALVGATAIALVTGIDFAVSAVPVTILVIFGALLASRPSATPGRFATTASTVVSIVLALGLFAWQLPRDLAHLAYDREALDRAVDLDPDFPAYRWRRALDLGLADPRAADRAAADARQAAEDARGLAPLWASAGVLDDGDRGAEALARACDLSPLGALPAFRLAVSGEEAAAGERAARALLASPVLLAAVDWAERPGLYEAGVGRVERWSLGEESWRDAFLAAAAAVEQRRAPSTPGETVSEDSENENTAALGLVVDADPATSLSLHAFRRRPRRAVLDAVIVRRDLVAEVQGFGLSAGGPGVSPRIAAPGCRLAPPWPASPVDPRLDPSLDQK